MRIVLQRVTEASVEVGGRQTGSIGRGYLLFVGVMQGDTEKDATYLTDKIASLRLFDGENGKINDYSIADTAGAVLVVSQFTLAGRTEKGNRPDYTAAADRETARILYESVIAMLRAKGIAVETGEFGTSMQVHLVNDGPVTLLLDSAL